MNRNGYLMAIVIVVALAGCTLADDRSDDQADRATPPPSSAAPSPSDPASPAPSSIAEPSTPSPEPDQNVADVTCETLLPQGWDDQDFSVESPRNPALFPDLAEKYLGTRFSDLGGVDCAVGYPNSDVATIYGWSPLDSADSAALRVTIADEGFEPRSEKLGEVWCRTIGEPREECYLFRGSDWFYSDDGATLEVLPGRVDAL